jgi:hypothetical protein
MVPHAGFRMTVALPGGIGPATRDGRRMLDLLIAVGRNNDDLEVSVVLPIVGCRGGGDARAPDRAFVVGDGRRVFARALARVEGRIAVDVYVEAGTLRVVVADVRACIDVVSL